MDGTVSKYLPDWHDGIRITRQFCVSDVPLYQIAVRRSDGEIVRIDHRGEITDAAIADARAKAMEAA